MKRPEELKKRNDKVSLYDLDTPQIRKGISGWKLTKRPIMPEGGEPLIMPLNETFDNPMQQSRKKSRSKKKARTGRQGDVLIDGKRFMSGTYNTNDEDHYNPDEVNHLV